MYVLQSQSFQYPSLPEVRGKGQNNDEHDDWSSSNQRWSRCDGDPSTAGGRIVKENPNECPNFQTELKRNSYAHPECSFINDRVPKDFCLACSYYKENIKGIDENIKEVSDAIKTYEEKAVIDDIMR